MKSKEIVIITKRRNEQNCCSDKPNIEVSIYDIFLKQDSTWIFYSNNKVQLYTDGEQMQLWKDWNKLTVKDVGRGKVLNPRGFDIESLDLDD